MPVRLARPIAAAALLFAMWALDSVRGGRPTAPAAAETAGPVRIIRFYASAGTIAPGQTAMLCYGVENARSVRISPLLHGVYPSPNRCLEIAPQRTTHYTILAEGYDGAVDARSLTLPVQSAPAPNSPAINIAVLVL